MRKFTSAKDCTSLMGSQTSKLPRIMSVAKLKLAGVKSQSFFARDYNLVHSTRIFIISDSLINMYTVSNLNEFCCT